MRVLISLCGVAIVTFVSYSVIPVNETTAGFAYLLLVLAIASNWGRSESTIRHSKLDLSETADSCTFCAKNLARRARWQSDSPNILWLSQLQFLTAAKVRRSRSSLPETMHVKRNPLRRHN